MFAALPLAVKVGVPIGLVLALLGGLVAYQHYQQNIGRAEAEAAHMAELLKQQQEATGYYIVSEALKLRRVERVVAEKDRLHAQLRESYQEVVAHEQREQVGLPASDRPACAVSPDLVRTVNGLARVLDAVSSERDAASGGAAGESVGSRGGAAAGLDRRSDGGGSGQADPRADGAPFEPHH